MNVSTNPRLHRLSMASSGRNSSTWSNPDLYLVRYIQTLFEGERSGISIQAPPRVIKYMRRFYDEIERCIKISPSSRQRNRLKSEAARFYRRASWRAEFRELAESCYRALSALADTVIKGRAGNSERYFGETRYPQRKYVNLAFKELDDLARSRSRYDWMVELRRPGNANRPSRGRALVAKYAIRLAEAQGVRLNAREVSEQIREYIKTAPPPLFNALCVQSPRKKQQPKLRLIKAAGT